ncbi:hypothetical protein Tco_0459830, partial [Tanacetum coccineum]
MASEEASERAAAEARENAAKEKAAVAKAEADARRRAERITVERVNAQFREKTAVKAQDRAAAIAAAKMNQQKNDNDLSNSYYYTFLSAMQDVEPGSLSQNNIKKASSTTLAILVMVTSDSILQQDMTGTDRCAARYDQHDTETELAQPTPDPPPPRACVPKKDVEPGSLSQNNIKKASSTTNIVDDLNSSLG